MTNNDKGFATALTFCVLLLGVESSPRAQGCDSSHLQEVMELVPPFIPVNPGVDPVQILNNAYGCEVMPALLEGTYIYHPDEQMSGDLFGIGQTVVSSANEPFGVITDWLVDSENTAQYALIERTPISVGHSTTTIAFPAGFIGFDQNIGAQIDSIATEDEANIEIFAFDSYSISDSEFQKLSNIGSEQLQMQPVYFERFGQVVLEGFGRLWNNFWNPPHILVLVESEPIGAEIYVDGISYASTTQLGYIDKRKFSYLTVEKDGYQPCGFTDGLFSDNRTTALQHSTFHCELKNIVE